MPRLRERKGSTVRIIPWKGVAGRVQSDLAEKREGFLRRDSLWKDFVIDVLREFEGGEPWGQGLLGKGGHFDLQDHHKFGIKCHRFCQIG